MYTVLIDRVTRANETFKVAFYWAIFCLEVSASSPSRVRHLFIRTLPDTSARLFKISPAACNTILWRYVIARKEVYALSVAVINPCHGAGILPRCQRTKFSSTESNESSGSREKRHAACLSSRSGRSLFTTRNQGK